jgi:hypothetical protein
LADTKRFRAPQTYAFMPSLSVLPLRSFHYSAETLTFQRSSGLPSVFRRLKEPKVSGKNLLSRSRQ